MLRSVGHDPSLIEPTSHAKSAMESRTFPLNELAWRRCDALGRAGRRPEGRREHNRWPAHGSLIAARRPREVWKLAASWPRFASPIWAASKSSPTGPTGGGPAVSIRTDHPVAACMASQYAGWQVSSGKFFAMGSGPMRAAAGREPLFEKNSAIARSGQSRRRRARNRQAADATKRVRLIAEQCGVAPECVTLLVARTASIAGTVQVVARSVETALHKNARNWDSTCRRVASGFGVAPLPPVAADDLAGIGRTNDAMLYGGEVTLWVRGDDDSSAQIGPQVPSSAFGRLRRAVSRHLRALQSRLLQDRSAAVQPGRRDARQSRHRPLRTVSATLRPDILGTLVRSIAPIDLRDALPMRFAVLAAPDSWYLRDLQRAPPAGTRSCQVAFSEIGVRLGGTADPRDFLRRAVDLADVRRRAGPHDAAGLARAGGVSHGLPRPARSGGHAS